MFGFGFDFSIGGGASSNIYDTDAKAFIDAVELVTPLSDTQKLAINTLTLSYKSSGVWAKRKAIYPFIGGVAGAHKFNLKDPRDLDAAFRLSFAGGLTHNSTGVTGNGVNGYINTHLIPTIDFTNNSIGFTISNRTNAATSTQDGTFSSSTLDFVWSLRWIDDRIFIDNFNSTTLRVQVTGITDARGITSLSRTGATTSKIFKNGVQVGSTLTTSVNNFSGLNGKIYLFNRTDLATSYSNKNYDFVSFGGGLTDAEQAIEHTIISTFNTALGR